MSPCYFISPFLPSSPLSKTFGMLYTMLLKQCNYVFHECHRTYYLSYGADSSCPLYLPVFSPVWSSFIPRFAGIHLQYLDSTYSGDNNERLTVYTRVIKCCIAAIWYSMSSAESAMKFCVALILCTKRMLPGLILVSTTSFNTEKLYVLTTRACVQGKECRSRHSYLRMRCR